MSSIQQNSLDLQAALLRSSDGEASGLIYLEQLDAGAECPAPNRPFLRALNRERSAAILFRPACNSWGCPVCAHANKKRWIARAIHGVEQLTAHDMPLAFLTLTSHEKLRGAASFRVWPKSWAKLRHRYYRNVSPEFRAYFAVPERHQDGTLHTHALIAGGLPERWWKDNARECGLGYMADVQEIANLGIAGYVGKYLGKTLHEGWPKGKRRVNTTRNWPNLESMSDLTGWTFSKVPQNRAIMAEIRDLQRNRYDVTLASAHGSWALVDQINAQTAL